MFGANIALTVTVVWLTVFMGRLDGSDVCNGETGKIPHPDSCAMYYDCSDPSKVDMTWHPYQRECTYSQLFDANSGSCEPWENVDCGDRPEVKNPCDYKVNQCGGMGHCQECVTRHPSCEGLEDGMQPFVGKEWTPYYAICRGERVEHEGTCPSNTSGYQIFDPFQKKCIWPTPSF